MLISLLLTITLIGFQTQGTPLKVTKTCGYASCPPWDPLALNVHLIPHSHDDLGWLKTVDKYYFQDVQNVISSVIGALKQNPERRFVQVETAYFKRWWDQQNDQMRQDVVNLVNSGQFEIINAGWCMNDEADVNYQSTIDQYTLGLRFIEDTLGKCGRPRVGWQIDTFGHSREQASISAHLGFDSLFFMRLDYRDQKKRLEEKTADLLWRGSANLGNSSDIFTSIFNRPTYSFPSGFCFDIVCNDDPIIDDEDSPDYNHQARVEEFATYVREQAKSYPSNNILVVMGDDVRYQAAFTNYLNIDRLIKGFSLFPQVYENKPIKIFYSTPSCYTKAVNDYVLANNYSLDIKTDDFLPYATDGYGYWSGFYTSRPSTKRFERIGNNFLQVAKQLAANTNQSYQNDITPLKEAMGVIQHHDAITGTEKQNVLKDYHRMLYSAMVKTDEFLDPIITKLLFGGSETSANFTSCLFANVSSCPPTKSGRFSLVVYNPLSREVSSPVSIPVDGKNWKILDPKGVEVTYQVNPTIIDFSYVNNVPISPNSLEFMAKNLPPLGFKLYTFEAVSASSPVVETKVSTKYGFNETWFDINASTGLMQSVTMNGITVELSQDLWYYESGDYSGAYIFVPKTNKKYRVAKSSVKTTPISGDVYQGVKQEFGPWATQVIKVYRDDQSYVEIDWVIGPVNISDGIGREVVSVFTSSLPTDGHFYTDSNGREMIKRTRNFRPTFNYTNEEPIAGNYHPVTSRIVLKDETKGLELAILNDRAQGGTSLEDGQVEIMIQRICPHHDFSKTNRNVGDNIDDQEYGQGVVIRGKHYLILGPKAGNGLKSLAAIQRDVAQKKILSPWNFVTNQVTKPTQPQLSLLSRSLSENVQILTLEPWRDNTLLIRLEHIMEKNEDDTLSQEVTIDLSDLFTQFTISELQEATLGGNMLLEESVRLHWPGSKDEGGSTKPPRQSGNFTITLQPMQIRTFWGKVIYGQK